MIGTLRHADQYAKAACDSSRRIAGIVSAVPRAAHAEATIRWACESRKSSLATRSCPTSFWVINSRAICKDCPCRYGGEEFALILSGVSTEAACKRAELLREDLKQLAVEHAGQVLGAVTLSIGVSAFPGHATAEELLRAADQALYRAKAEGRDRIIVG